jgi:ElaB/YqjD/DUF883 family membrane-anchored ribosome-binding protein
VNTLEELKARMDEIKEELKALMESAGSPEADEARLEKAERLQAEGKILGDKFRAIKLEQQAAVEFAEEILNEAAGDG